MIVHPTPDVLRVLFTLKGSIVKRIALRCLMVTLLAALIVLVERHFPAFFYPVSATPFTLLGLSLSIFMSFRNNACYDRWWEGRKAWGKLIIETRSFVRESVVIADEALRAELLRSLCGYAHALNARLRNEDDLAAARPWLARPETISPHNVCDGILRDIGQHCSRLAEQQHISDWRYSLLEQRLVGLTEVQATCERIKFTPLPFPYTLLLHRTIYIFCLLLPFALAEPLGWLAPLFTTIVGYTFFGLDAIGNELEDPFGRDENDLPTDAMVRTVERDVLAGLGETQLPPALLPVEHVLS
ncbi:bestrophin family protein [Pseudomonas monteilii]|jgi:putative membrane protein|uniref:Bestrophin n=2 Tax=Pseudomonas putida group TaxID=136845 RepID=A0AAE6RER6_9PSED|nr:MULTISPECIES: bestrophin family protein [Pseudomonas]MBB3271586.1 putative membrane protein [Pseudomonas sp. OG7]MBH3396931.1 bestrophin family protein [Pseudomonas monteilii]MBH3456607.1 bestrophin family protein [Pseudomonas monteilii]MCJ7852692.1 bestrophin family protein [Pseudomonas monteilii]MDD2125497.1 bestrophin family protein [Pseudomonas monteilii]